VSWSLLEAMSLGCAILASDTAPLQEAIRHGENGWLVDFFDQNGLVNNICALLDDPERRAQLSSAARKFACETYDLKTCCLPKQIEWVDQLLNAKTA
jgi:glycosyltransferase involved in cell wall biosynthesis